MPDFAHLWSLAPWLLLILAAEFVNGWTDAPNAIATVVSTRVMRPHHAVLMAAVLNLAGTFAGTAVAATIGKGIINPDLVDIQTVGAAMMGIVVWSTIAWYYGLPTSESHGLVAGLAGAGLATAGWDALLWEGWRKVLIGIFYSSFLGFFIGLFFMIAILWVCRRWTPGTVKKVFSRLQILSAAFMAFGHGSNDGQKFMGVFTLALMLGGALPKASGDSFPIPMWVILLCAVTMAVGTASGGWRIIKTMGLRLTKLEPIHGFAAETASGLTIMIAGHAGVPLSTTHTIST
ncbi:MAG TPA: inorganic phosphate transporter, partial [Vicinamibacteria bacterium]|nr:inorganic phosphate transporter [Vicinamibacteria bacterium]